MTKHKKKQSNPWKYPKLVLTFGVGIVVAFSSISYLSLRAPVLPSPPLKDLAAKHGIDLGMLVYDHKLNNRIYPDLVRNQFGLVTIDGGAHFKELRPSETEFDFSTSDTIVAFAEANNMPVQLHHLIWGDRIMIPKWLEQGNYSKDQLRAILRDHITKVMQHYKGRVREYSVVNEAFTEAQHLYGLRSFYGDELGYEYELLDDYFRWARQADPDAKLILNDFNNETKNKVSDAMYAYIKAAKARGVPIDGIGMQMHINASNIPPKQALLDNMKRFGELGVSIYITEFDVNSNSVKRSEADKNQLETRIMYDVTRACIESRVCKSMTVFGLTMKNDLVKKLTRANSRDLLFTSRFEPTPAYFGLRQAFSE